MASMTSHRSRVERNCCMPNPVTEKRPRDTSCQRASALRSRHDSRITQTIIDNLTISLSVVVDVWSCVVVKPFTITMPSEVEPVEATQQTLRVQVLEESAKPAAGWILQRRCSHKAGGTMRYSTIHTTVATSYGFDVSGQVNESIERAHVLQPRPPSQSTAFAIFGFEDVFVNHVCTSCSTWGGGGTRVSTQVLTKNQEQTAASQAVVISKPIWSCAHFRSVRSMAL